ncbi:MAG: SDR family NAD(P)-dependent oxidoreductase, partial [Thermoplasmata archaeon]
MALAPGSRFRGEAAVLTGASGGIGAAIAPALSGAGFRLLLTGRDGAALERVADPIRRAGGEARTFVLDLLEPGAPERLRAEAIRALGVPYLLVNDAGSLRVERLERRPPEEIARELALDLAVPIALTRAFLPVLLQRGRGQILNVGSAVVDLPLPRLAVYAAAKAGLR